MGAEILLTFISFWFSFEYLHLSLKRELSDMMRAASGIHLTGIDNEKIINAVEIQFKEILEKHKRRSAKWYNNDGRYRSAVIEMLNMKENAMAVPELSDEMHVEWISKHPCLRQANRIVSKDMSR